MILNVSGRTDVVAFYFDWFMNRIKEGFVDVRNPFYPKNVSRIYFKDVDLIVFCTKNPIPLMELIEKIKIKSIIHITLTSYKKDIEPNVPPKGDIIESIKILSRKIGIDNIYIRYDPIFISDKYTIDYHIKCFNKLCNLLDGYVKNIIISFIDDYKNVRKNKNVLKLKKMTDDDYKKIGISFFEISKKHDIIISTCGEKNNLKEYGFKVRDCMSASLAFKLTGKTDFKKWHSRNNKYCNCVSMVDIGEYNTCMHHCKYCYANFDEDKIEEKGIKHNPNSSLLIGDISDDDIIKIRK